MSGAWANGTTSPVNFTVKTDDPTGTNLDYSITGLNTNVARRDFNTNNAAAQNNNVSAKGDQFVVVTIYGLKDMTELYDITADTTKLTANELGAIQYFNGAGVTTATADSINNFFTTGAADTYTDTLKVEFDRAQDIPGGNSVQMTVTVAAGNENMAYDVTVTINGTAYNFYDLTGADSKWITVNGDLQIDDVVAVASIKKLALNEDATKAAAAITNGGLNLTIYFNQKVTNPSGADLVAGDFIGQGVSIVAVQNLGDRVILTFNEALTNGDIITVQRNNVIGTNFTGNTLTGTNEIHIVEAGGVYSDSTLHA